MSEATVATQQTNPPDPNLLHQQEYPGYRLSLRLANEQLKCRADLQILKGVPIAIEAENETTEAEESRSENSAATNATTLDVAADTTALTPPELISLLHKYNISQTINFDGLYRFCAAAAEKRAQQDVLLAEGYGATSGTDGWFELAVKTKPEQTEFEEDANGRVDLRTLHTFTEIEVGQKLGTVHPPQEGTPGMTANGLPIPAEKGKPFPLIAGQGVILKYDDRIAFAERAGRALLDKQTLSVVDELIVSGDLDLKVGNIDFHGYVEIKGDVPDDFSVKASKGIRISGVIGNGQIESGGSMEIGSVAGKETGKIICHGDFKANYLNQAMVLCYGNVFVSNEIRNSHVKATGQIIVERGSIIGGRCIALEGIEAKILGATSGLHTELVAGIYFPDADRFDYLHERLSNINRQLKLIHEALGPLERVKELGEAFDNASELRLSILNLQWEKLEQEKEQSIMELAASQPQVFSHCNPKVNAIKAIKEGVKVRLGQAVTEFKIERSGPLTLIENTREGGLRQLSLSPLNKLAIEIEEEILEEELRSDALTEQKKKLPGPFTLAGNSRQDSLRPPSLPPQQLGLDSEREKDHQNPASPTTE